MKNNSPRRFALWAVASLGAAVAVAAAACGGDEAPAATPVIIKETVIVEKSVIQTVVVEKPIAQTVIVEKPVIQTVVVEKQGQTITKIEERIVVATPTPAPASASLPSPKNKVGELSFALVSVGKGVGVNSAGSSNYRFGITESPFMTLYPGQVAGMLVESWSRSSDGNTLTIKTRKGVKFHQNYGEMTAADFAWNMNDVNANVTKGSISFNAGDYAALFKEAKAIDGVTVEVPINSWDVTWAANQLNNQGQTMEVFSKAAYDKNGRDWAIKNIIGTGPAELVEYRDNQRVIAKAVQSHWRKTPEWTQMTYLEIPEAAIRKAAVVTGEVDMGELTAPDQSDLAAKGFSLIPANAAKAQVVIFGGNYWEDFSARDGSPLEPWKLGGFKTDLPWVGNPWGTKVPYTDTNNPAGIDDMEQARLVRWAMAMAYDRDTIVKQVFAGQAVAGYISMFETVLPEWNDKWKVPYDPKKAEEYLDKAGYPKGKDGYRADVNGVKFEISFRTFPGFPPEMLQAIAGYWDKIGIKTEAQMMDYAIFRPTVVDRSNSLVYIQGCRHHNTLPWDWPRAPQNTSLTRGGFGCGIEMPWIADGFKAANNEADAQKRIEINNKMADNMYNWMPQAGIVTVPQFVTANPKSIAKWEMRDGFESQLIHGIELIQLTKR